MRSAVVQPRVVEIIIVVDRWAACEWDVKGLSSLDGALGFDGGSLLLVRSLCFLEDVDEMLPLVGERRSVASSVGAGGSR
jgi:hypothetical protein